MQVLRPVELSALTIIMLIGVIALIVEITNRDEIAKIIVVPSLCLLVIVTGYTMFKGLYRTR